MSFKSVFQHDAGLVRQLQPGRLNRGLLALDAAGRVEAVEAARQLLEIAVDVAGVIVPGRQLDLLAELSDLLDEGPLRLSGEQGHVHIRPGRHC